MNKPVFKIESRRHKRTGEKFLRVVCDRVGFGAVYVADHNEAYAVIQFFTKWYATDENY